MRSRKAVSTAALALVLAGCGQGRPSRAGSEGGDSQVDATQGGDAGSDSQVDATQGGDAGSDSLDSGVDSSVDAMQGGDAGGSSILVPSTGAWWGIYASPSSGQNWYTAVTERETQVGRKFDVVKRYEDWTSAFPDAYASKLIQSGHILHFAWASRIWSSGANITWAEIADGSQDNVIDAEAARLKAMGARFFIDFDHEMDGAEHSGDGTPSEYVAAYLRIQDRFEAAGVTNAVWVWVVTGCCHRSQYVSLFPGDSYVDWIGWDPYNWYTCRGGAGTWKDFHTTASSAYDWFNANSGPGHDFKSHPYMLAEYGSVENPTDATGATSKAAWFRKIPSQIQSLPNLRAVEYFNSGSGCAWYYETSTSSIAGYKAAGGAVYLSPPP